jgi:hypothetical protein
MAEPSHECRYHCPRVSFARRQSEDFDRHIHGESTPAKALVLTLTRYQLESAISIEPAVDTIRRIVLDVQKGQARVLTALSDKEISESNGMARSVLVYSDTHQQQRFSTV